MTSKQALGLTMNELAEVNAEHVTTISKLDQKLTDMAVQLANAESKCRELAAENAGLNDKMNKLATWPGIEFYSSAWEFCNLDGNDALEFMCDVKTPATDAFLAEVRAQGVKSPSNAVQSVIAERQRHQSAEGWTPEHDDQYSKSQLLWASSCYVLNAIHPFNRIPFDWPWTPEWWKPTNPRRDLVKAGALILAELERIDRAAGIGKGE